MKFPFGMVPCLGLISWSRVVCNSKFDTLKLTVKLNLDAPFGATLSNHFGFKDQLLEGAGAILVDNIPTSLDLQISEPPKSHGHS